MSPERNPLRHHPSATDIDVSTVDALFGDSNAVLRRGAEGRRRAPLAEATTVVAEAGATALERRQEYNPSHDAIGRFASKSGGVGGGGTVGGGGGAGSSPTMPIAADIGRVSLNEAIDDWTRNGFERAQVSADALLTTGVGTGGQSDATAATMLDAIHSGPAGTGTLYRGLNFPRGQDLDAFLTADLDVGGEVSFGLASFTKSSKMAEVFSGPGNGHSVVIKTKGYRGLDLGRKGSHPGEKEVVLSGGPYRVIQVQRGGSYFSRRVEITVEYAGA